MGKRVAMTAHSFMHEYITFTLSHTQAHTAPASVLNLPSLLSVRLNILLGGMTPLYFHVVNVCLHCAVTCLLMHTCERCVFEDPRLALITALLFAVHPVHTEAVSIHDHTLSRNPRAPKKEGASFINNDLFSIFPVWPSR